MDLSLRKKLWVNTSFRCWAQPLSPWIGVLFKNPFHEEETELGAGKSLFCGHIALEFIKMGFSLCLWRYSPDSNIHTFRGTFQRPQSISEWGRKLSQTVNIEHYKSHFTPAPNLLAGFGGCLSLKVIGLRRCTALWSW